jgi:hypothetical protein
LKGENMNAVTQHESTDMTKTICFPLGHIVATPGALELLDRMAVNASELLQRHQRGDWGDVPPEDAAENEFAIVNGLRILSSYSLGEDRVWVITEADRSATTLLLPQEY